MAKEKRHAGGQPGNYNGTRFGLYSPRGPKGHAWLDRKVGQFMRFIEAEILELKGRVTPLDAALIHTATQAARIGMAYLSELKDDSLTLEQRIAVRSAALKALDVRDRKLKELGLESPVNGAADPWGVIDSERTDERLAPIDDEDAKPTQEPPQPAQVDSGASGSVTDDVDAIAEHQT